MNILEDWIGKILKWIAYWNAFSIKHSKQKTRNNIFYTFKDKLLIEKAWERQLTCTAYIWNSIYSIIFSHWLECCDQSVNLINDRITFIWFIHLNVVIRIDITAKGIMILIIIMIIMMIIISRILKLNNNHFTNIG